MGLRPIHHRDQLWFIGRRQHDHVGHRSHDRQVLHVEVGLTNRADE
jgi:hypothetical protein